MYICIISDSHVTCVFLQYYDFILYTQLPDGASTLLVDNDAIPNPILYVGGNCTIQGFDHHGNDLFWTVRNYRIA